MGRMIFMSRLLACKGMINTAERDGHATDAGVIVGQRAQGGLDERYEVRMVWEKGLLPERSERFSASAIMSTKRTLSRLEVIWVNRGEGWVRLNKGTKTATA